MAIANSELDKSQSSNQEGENQVLLESRQEKATMVATIRETAINGENDLDASPMATKTDGVQKPFLDDMEEGTNIPKDKHRLVYFIFVLHGIGILMAWNMFITAKSYFQDYKLNREIFVNQSNANFSQDYLDVVESYRQNFLPWTGIAAQIPNVLFNGVNLFVQSKSGNMNLRITAMIIIEILVYVVTIILALLDSSSWPGTFFWITMVSVVIMNMANGVYQSAVYGIAARLPMSYSNAVVLGSNICGTLVSIIAIVSQALSPDIKTSAFFYFVTTLLVLILCLISFHALHFNRFYQYYNLESSRNHDDDGMNVRPKRQYGYVFGKIWPQCLNVFMVFFVTLSMFPAILAGIETSGQFADLGSFFTPITCFLTFNAMAMFGNLIPNWIITPGPKKLWMPVFARLLFIPFFLFCNYRPDIRTWPVLIANDYVYLIGGILFGLTSGYYSSLSMMYAPKQVDPEHSATAAMMAAFFLIFGIFIGVWTQFLWPHVVAFG